jgi:hypothetical protein
MGKKAFTRSPNAYPEVPEPQYSPQRREITKPRVIYEESFVEMPTSPRIVRRAEPIYASP